MLGITAEQSATHAMVTSSQAPQKSLHTSVPVQIANRANAGTVMGKINLE
jgi:hypothetical protein